LTVVGRQQAVARLQSGAPVAQMAAAAGLSRQTLYKWLRRAAAAAPEWTDRSSRPQRFPTRLPRHRRRQIEKVWRRRWSSPRIAQHYQLPLATVVTHVRRVGLGQLRPLAPAVAVRRDERAYPGELVHLDAK
jgi:transposase